MASSLHKRAASQGYSRTAVFSAVRAFTGWLRRRWASGVEKARFGGTFQARSRVSEEVMERRDSGLRPRRESWSIIRRMQ